MTTWPGGAFMLYRSAFDGLDLSELMRGRFCMLYSSPLSLPVVSAPQYLIGMCRYPPPHSAAVRNLSIRVSSNVDFCDRRQRAAVATMGLALSSRARNPSSVLARAGMGAPLVGDAFIGTSMPCCSRKDANLGAEATMARTCSIISSSVSVVSLSMLYRLMPSSSAS